MSFKWFISTNFSFEGAIFTIVVVVYSTIRAVHIVVDKKGEDIENAEPFEGPVTYSYSMFHFIFLLVMQTFFNSQQETSGFTLYCNAHDRYDQQHLYN